MSIRYDGSAILNFENLKSWLESAFSESRVFRCTVRELTLYRYESWRDLLIEREIRVTEFQMIFR